MTALSNPPTGPEMKTPLATAPDEHYRHLQEVFSQYTTANLAGISPEDFRARIEGLIGSINYQQEGYSEEQLKYQRDLSVKFHWGHSHDFGDFSVEGRMHDRHLYLMADFCTHFSIAPQDFSGKNVLDVGCWTGGTTLLLLGLGAEVIAVEEVKKYAETAEFLIDSFGLGARGKVLSSSVFDLPKYDLFDRFHAVYVPGVLYHLSDPVLGLRHLFNTLKIGGIVLVESAGFDSEELLCRFGGSRIHHAGFERDLSRAGWNWFSPSWMALKAMMVDAGFDDVGAFYSRSRNRVYAIGHKRELHDICRAGLSVPDVA